MSRLLSDVCESYLGNREAISAVVVSVSHVFSVLAVSGIPEKEDTHMGHLGMSRGKRSREMKRREG